MTQYARISNNQVVTYPLTQMDIQLRYPNISFVRDNFIPPQGYEVVNPMSPPDVDHTENTELSTPVFLEDGWYQNWIITPATESQIEARTQQQMTRVRAQRDQLLRDSDYTRMDDVPLTEVQRADWAHYRQQLRDITSQQGWPWHVTWPQKP